MRLSRALENALAGRGVEVVTDRIVGYEMSNGRVTALRGSSRWMCEKVILATGRVLGGGIVSEAGVTRERIFGLPIWAGGRPIADRFTGDLTGQSVDATHELFRAGVAYDDKLRPLNEFGEIFATNVYAAGSILGGYDPAQDFTGIGVAAWTGYLAGNSLA
jgi:glycerol-3-phosphate dehydrogenase subunit B